MKPSHQSAALGILAFVVFILISVWNQFFLLWRMPYNPTSALMLYLFTLFLLYFHGKAIFFALGEKAVYDSSGRHPGYITAGVLYFTDSLGYLVFGCIALFEFPWVHVFQFLLSGGLVLFASIKYPKNLTPPSMIPLVVRKRHKIIYYLLVH